MLIKRVHYIVRSSAFYSQNPYCAIECNVSFHINNTQLSVVQFHAKHYTTECNISFHINTTQLSIVHFHAKYYMIEYNVFFVSALCIVSLEIVCILFSRNLSSKLRQRGPTVDTQFRDS